MNAIRDDLRGVTFDFGGTLALGDLDKEGFRHHLFKYICSLGYAKGFNHFRKAHEGVLKRLMVARNQNREIRIEDLYQGLLFRLGLHPEKESLAYIHHIYIRSFNVELVFDAKTVLRTLKKRYALAVISNAMSNVPRYAIETFDLEQFFNSIVVSRDIGIRKPDPEIFNFTLNSLGLKPNEVIHVGDSLEHDILGAKKARMKAIWIQREGEESYIHPDYTIHSLQELLSCLYDNPN